MKKILSLFTAIATVATVGAQEHVRTKKIGREHTEAVAFAVTPTYDSSFVITGYIDDTSIVADAMLMKIKKNAAKRYCRTKNNWHRRAYERCILY